ncbi:MAG: FtsW/RodA/SpoVE family cell cycle protein [Acidimicrobiia bacterium]|nr:FtsW/RodA/SpoVE family cell cycle protein [Acidimicrobiia bacterium]MDH4308651.1 FtsW/RodA/SpoVE family cell cycle protein [Acidimicrobiia bacterium]MDH5293015.1 FtsW/RodA/SpoVE family cell cycle protein [Acidimicrobiia bacterium]
MTRAAEAALLFGAALLAALGVTMVNLVGGGGLDAQVALTFMTMAIAFGAVHVAIRSFAPEATATLLPPVALVSAFGMIEIYRLDPYRASLQRWWLLLGAAAAIVTLAWLSRTGLNALRRYRNVMFLLGVGLLLLPMLPTTGGLPVRGLEANGSRLWILVDLGFVQLNFQPGEVAKILFVGFLAAYLADRNLALTGARRKIGPLAIPEPRQLAPLVLVWAASLGVLVVQRDLGASLLLFAVFVAVLYAATGSGGYLTGGALLATVGAVASWRLFDHVDRRVTAWLRPFSDYEDAGYQIAQGIFALGTGSLSGAGPGLGRPDLIPFASTDFIFAAVGEEFGFAGSVAVLCSYALIVATGFGIALRTRDPFRKLLAAGLAFGLGVQVFLIIGGVVRVVPLTGITLPFMSYGGSSLLGNFVLVAMLARISHEEAA